MVDVREIVPTAHPTTDIAMADGTTDIATPKDVLSAVTNAMVVEIKE